MQKAQADSVKNKIQKWGINFRTIHNSFESDRKKKTTKRKIATERNEMEARVVVDPLQAETIERSGIPWYIPPGYVYDPDENDTAARAHVENSMHKVSSWRKIS